MSPSYVKDFEHRSPNVHAIFRRHLFTRRASSAPVTLDWQLMPTRASLDSPISAAFRSARGLAEYVYREPAVARTPSQSVTTVGSASQGRSSESFEVQAPSMSPLSRPHSSRAETAPPSWPCIRASCPVALA